MASFWDAHGEDLPEFGYFQGQFTGAAAQAGSQDVSPDFLPRVWKGGPSPLGGKGQKLIGVVGDRAAHAEPEVSPEGTHRLRHLSAASSGQIAC